MTDTTHRPLNPGDAPFLREMLFLAIYPPSNDRSLLVRPELSRYFEDWGRPGDEGWAAVDGKLDADLGALWIRRFPKDAPGYGFIHEDIPELSMSLWPPYRGRGIGTALLEHALRTCSSPSLSLSVHPDNSVLRLYERVGFKRIGMSGDSLTMQWIRSRA